MFMTLFTHGREREREIVTRDRGDREVHGDNNTVGDGVCERNRKIGEIGGMGRMMIIIEVITITLLLLGN